MKKNIYSVYDLKGLSYGPTFEYGQDEEAKRFGKDLANDKRGQCGRFPADYVIHRLGHFDDGTGRLYSLEQPELVACLSELVVKDVNE